MAQGSASCSPEVNGPRFCRTRHTCLHPIPNTRSGEWVPSLTSLEAGSLEDWLGFKTKVSLVALHEFTNGKGPGVRIRG